MRSPRLAVISAFALVTILGALGVRLVAGARDVRSPAGPGHPGHAREVDAAARTSGATASAPFDPSRVIEQVEHAFREGADGTWRSDAGTHAVTVSAGALEVRPLQSGPGAGAPGPGRGGAVRFAPAVIVRSDLARSSAAGTSRRGRQGELETVRGAVTERVRNARGGVEQSWHFAEHPAGTGDLEVRLALEAGAFVDETERGLGFATSGGLGIRYGHATWIDALGQRTSVPARWVDGEIVLRVPAGVVDGSLYPSVLDPVISPEFDLSRPVYHPARGGNSVVASDGTQFLVVWFGTYTTSTVSMPALYGTRVDRAGEVLDPAGILISGLLGSAPSMPAVSFGAGSYLLVWAFNYHLRAIRVSAAGVVLDTAEFPITGRTTGSEYAPAVAWNGEHHLVVWQRSSGSDAAVEGVRVTSAGVVQDAEPIPIGAGTSPAVASDGSGYLVASVSGAYVVATRVSGAGAVLAPAAVVLSDTPRGQTSPAVAWNGTTYLVAWEDGRNETSPDLYGARVTPAGDVLDTGGGIAIATGAGTQKGAKVASDGTDFLVAWQSGYAIVQGARVSGAGVVLDQVPIQIAIGASPPNGYAAPALAWGGHTYLVTWNRSVASGESGGIDAARVTSDGVVHDPAGFLLTWEANGQVDPRVASDGAGYLVVWRDGRSPRGLYGSRVSHDGGVLDWDAILIATTGFGNDISVSSIAWNGTSYLVVWQEGGSWFNYYRYWSAAYAARVSPAGAVLEPRRLQLGYVSNGPSLTPRAASNGSDWLVVWHEPAASGYLDVKGARVAADGSLLDSTPRTLSDASWDQKYPAVSSDGHGWFVAWQDNRNVGWDVYGTRVDAAATPLDPAGIPISRAAGDQTRPAVAWGSSAYLVVFESGGDLFGARVDGSASVLDPDGVPISQGPGDQLLPAVAWDGANYLVVWEDHRGGTPDVYGARVTGDAVVRSASGIPLAVSSGEERTPDVAAAGPDAFLVVYDGYYLGPGAGANAVRVRARTVSTVNGAPLAGEVTVTTAKDVPVAVTLLASDADGDPLTYTTVSSPGHGTLSGTAPGLTYTPDPGFVGTDGFTFKANDGLADSAVATVSITVTPVESVTPAQGGDSGCGCGAGAEPSQLAAVLLALAALRPRRRAAGTPSARGTRRRRPRRLSAAAKTSSDGASGTATNRSTHRGRRRRQRVQVVLVGPGEP